MFRQLSDQLGGNPAPLLLLHPEQIARLAELVWVTREPLTDPTGALGDALPAALSAALTTGIAAPTNPSTVTNIDHLIYAYMIENTRVYEIFGRVVKEFAQGERLETPLPSTRRWLRASEALVYGDPPATHIWNLTSSVRPDIRATRRNAYYRAFGLDLNHGTDSSQPYPFEKPAASNRDFVSTFEDLLRETWRGIENVTNTAGARPIDNAAIGNFARRLKDMLTIRRANGNLARDEFVHVSVMSWLHMTISFNSPVIVDLKAEAGSPDERLRKVGERVGLPPHAKSESYLSMAEALSTVLRFIEGPTVFDASTAPLFYQTGTLPQSMQTIINHWSIATGRDMKARPVAIAASSRS
jgi:hypothetical protein